MRASAGRVWSTSADGAKIRRPPSRRFGHSRSLHAALRSAKGHKPRAASFRMICATVRARSSGVIVRRSTEGAVKCAARKSKPQAEGSDGVGAAAGVRRRGICRIRGRPESFGGIVASAMESSPSSVGRVPDSMWPTMRRGFVSGGGSCWVASACLELLVGLLADLLAELRRCLRQSPGRLGPAASNSLRLGSSSRSQRPKRIRNCLEVR